VLNATLEDSGVGCVQCVAVLIQLLLLFFVSLSVERQTVPNVNFAWSMKND